MRLVSVLQSCQRRAGPCRTSQGESAAPAVLGHSLHCAALVRQQAAPATFFWARPPTSRQERLRGHPKKRGGTSREHERSAARLIRWLGERRARALAPGQLLTKGDCKASVVGSQGAARALAPGQLIHGVQVDARVLLALPARQEHNARDGRRHGALQCAHGCGRDLRAAGRRVRVDALTGARACAGARSGCWLWRHRRRNCCKGAVRM